MKLQDDDIENVKCENLKKYYDECKIEDYKKNIESREERVKVEGWN